ncbi:MAG: tetratricopeptide repeat protein [Patescibacteria group bacterium]
MFKKNITFIILLVIVGFSIYAPNLNNRLFWDDNDWIINNPYVHSFSWDNIKFLFSHDTLAGIGLRSNYFRPFLFLTFAFNYMIDGIKPMAYHLTSNIIHVLNAVLIFLIVEKFIRKKRVALLASLLFLIHPLQTEAVAYVSGRGDPLSVFFMLLALWIFTVFRDKNLFLGYSLSSVSMILGILSRETAFLFPIYFIIFSVAFLQKDRFLPALKKSIIQAWPYWVISFTYGILRLTVLNFQNTLNFYQQSNFYTEHLSYRIYTFFHSLVVYFKLIFIPAGLHMERDIVVNSAMWQWPVWLGILIILGLIFLLFYLYRKGSNSLNAKPYTLNPFSVWFFAWGFFFVNLAPTSGIFPINALIYEHWLYFSLFGFFVLAAFYIDKLVDHLKLNSRVLFAAFYLFFAGYLIFLSVQSVRRNIIWGKTEEFYKNILQYESQNVRALNNLAMYYSEQGKIKEAEDLYWRAVDANNNVPAPYYNLGNILRDRGDIAGALELYKKSIEHDHNFVYGYMNIAVIYADQGNLAGAIEMLEKVKELKPNDARVYYNLGLLYLAEKNNDLALKNLLMADKLAENDPEVKAIVDDLMGRLEKKK